MFQLCTLKEKDDIVVDFIKTSDKKQFEDRTWIESIWSKLILQHFSDSIAKFEGLSVFPTNFQNQGHMLKTITLANNHLLVKSENVEKNADHVITKAFSNLGVKVVTPLPNWIDTTQIKRYLHYETSQSLLQMFEKITSNGIVRFNKKSSPAESDTIRKYLSRNLQHVPSKSSVLARLNLFQLYEGPDENCTGYTNIETCNKLYLGQSFPIKYPFPVIKISKENKKVYDQEKGLVNLIGAGEFEDIDLVKHALGEEGLQKYATKDINKLMEWILMETLYLDDQSVLDSAKQVSFLESGTGSFAKAYDLFDPTDEMLTKIFKDELVFPKIPKDKHRFVDGLKRMGLKQKQDITEKDLDRVIRSLDKSSKAKENINIDKASAVVKFANGAVELLNNDSRNKQWIPVSFNGHYPMCMPMVTRDVDHLCSPSEISSAEFVNTIGSVVYVHECTSVPKLATYYNWTDPPCMQDVLSHLGNIIKHYTHDGKVECNQMVKDVYISLAEFQRSSEHELFEKKWNTVFPQNVHCVWNGDGFSPVKQMIIQKQDGDPDLQPYMHVLPSELNPLNEFFTVIGCTQLLCCNTYTSVLKQLKEDSDAGKHNNRRMLDITFVILNKLKEGYSYECKTDGIVRENLFVPVISNEQNRLVMKHINECAYLPGTQDMSVEDSDDLDMHLVHPDISGSIAEALGVRTLKQQMLSDADGFEEWGQEEPLTRRLHTLLKEGYVDGFAVAKELFQNANDARASKLHILYDERTNEDAKTLLINAELAEWQGPALWIYNDAEFSENDFRSITKLNGGTKEDDVRKIGRFGLGFCAVYNITDVPSFVSGENYVIFDPHTTNLGEALPGKSPGLRLNFANAKNKKCLRKMAHQFKTFDGVFDFHIEQCNMPYFKGTLFRLPLRKRGSEISPNVYTRDDVIHLLKQLVECASNMFIFTQHVSELKIFHLKDGHPSTKKQLFCVEKTHIETCPNGFQYGSAVEKAATRKEERLNVDSEQSSLLPFTGREDIQILSRKTKNALLDFRFKYIESCCWSVAWATGSQPKTLEITDTEKGALPLASVAVPYNKTEWRTFPNVPAGFYNTGHFYFYLPLPIQHSFKFHINGQFNVTSDRTRFRMENEDERSSKTGEWNRCLLRDSAVEALLFLLESSQTRLLEDPYILWPCEHDNPLEELFCKSFYEHITGDLKAYNIFKSAERNTFYTFADVKFLDTTLRNVERVGDIALMLLQKKTDNLVDIPKTHYNSLHSVSQEKVEQRTISRKRFILDHFLMNIEQIDNSDRDELMFYILKHMFEDIDIQNWLKSNPCIPAQPNGMLKKPSQLVDPKCHFFDLFKISDGVFPSPNYCSPDEDIRQRLIHLGMIDTKLPPELVLDRAETVQVYLQSCAQCALDQSRRLMMYFDKVKTENNVLVGLNTVGFLPVLPRPNGWPFPWKMEEFTANTNECDEHKHTSGLFVFTSPNNIYAYSDLKLVSCTSLVLDQDSLQLNSDMSVLLDKIGVRRAHDYILVFEQLKMMSKHHVPISSTESKRHAEDAIESVYTYLDNACDNNKSHIYHLFRDIKLDMVFIENRFVNQCRVAKKYVGDCRPCLFSLHDSPLCRFQMLTEACQIKDKFGAEYIVGRLTYLHQQYNGEPLVEEDFQVSLKLLRYLELLGKKHELPDVSSFTVYVPDEHIILRPSTDLCFNDFDDIEKSETMIYVHGDVSPNTAKVVGVKNKHIKHFEESSDDVVDFYQDEPLLTRLKHLTEAYPCDISIFKELLQNADDAGAIKIHFILDKTTHSSERILDSRMSELQGPALCVFNNSSFTQNDLRGITKLGQGSKECDPATTGKYGVGFNSVYNLTDAPSFFTKGEELEHGETLCFFDPLAKYVPSVTREKPGKRHKLVASIRQHHPDTMSGYHEKTFFKGGNGTMFRFPLRQRHSEIKDEGITVAEMEFLLKEFIKEIPLLLLFLRNVTEIQVTHYDHHGYVNKSHVFVQLEENDRQKRDEFTQTLKGYYSDLKSHTLSCQQTLTNYKITLERKNDCSQPVVIHYQIVQAVGFSKGIGKTLREVVESGKLKLIPHAGVAYKLKSKHPDQDSDYKNKVYCYLPLTIESGMPVDIHGCFVLGHESRRDLWLETQAGHACFRTQWNESLIENVVTDVYVALIDVFKNKCTNICKELAENGKNFSLYISDHVKDFEDVFPSIESAEGHYWKRLAESVYKKMVNTQTPFLPVISQSTCEISKRLYSTLQWTPLIGETFPAYHSGISNDPSDKVYMLNNTVRSIGMRVVTVCSKVRESMEKSNVPLESISPNCVINFLCSHTETATDTCQIKVGQELQDSVLKNVTNAECLINYIRKDIDKSTIEQIPLMVTQDSTIQSLNNCEHSLFVTPFVDFFPLHNSKFLHSKLQRCIGHEHKIMNATDNLKTFELSNFVALGETSDCIEKAPHKYVPWKEDNPKMSFLQMFWEFFKHHFNKNINNSMGEQLVSSMLNEMSFLALVLIDDPLCPQKLLCATSQLHTLIDIDSFTGVLLTVIRKFRLPTLNDAPMMKAHGNLRTEELVLSSVRRQMMARIENPELVLKCFNHHQQRLIDADNITDDDCRVILQYFAEHMHFETFYNMQQLRMLPFYVTTDGVRRSLSNVTDIYIVPKDLPGDGIQSLIEKESIALVKKEDSLKMLYSYVAFIEVAWLDVYVKYIIPRQHILSREDFYSHIRYLAKMVSPMNHNEYKTLTKVLSRTKFIEAENGQMLCPDKLFDHTLKVFQLCCESHELLPIDLREHSVLCFMRILGLRTTCTLVDFCRFAKDIEHETESAVRLTDHVEAKSAYLLEAVISMPLSFFKKNVLHELAGIRFVLRMNVGEPLKKLHTQYQPTLLMSYKDSIPSCKANICWTTCNVLPKKYEPGYPCAKEGLQVLEHPSTDMWVKHVKLVGVSIRDNILIGTAAFKLEDSLLRVLKDIYASVPSDVGEHVYDLRQTPLIYYSDRRLLIPPKNIANECIANDDEIPPYLMKAPVAFGEHFERFVRIGASSKITCDMLAQVLFEIKESMKQGPELLPKEEADARKAMTKMLKILTDEESDVKISVSTLYFVCFKEYNPKATGLEDASTLVINDNDSLYQRITKSNANLKFVICLPELKRCEVIERIQRIPELFRPHLLSKVVHQEVDQSRIENLNSSISSGAEYHIHSNDFCQVFLRLAKHSRKQHTREWSIGLERELVEAVRKVKLINARNIFTDLKLSTETLGSKENLQTLQNTSEENNVYIDEQENVINIYYKYNESWYSEVREQLSEFLNRKFDLDLSNLLFLLVKMLHKDIHVQEIKTMMDKAHVDVYESSIPIDTMGYPIPGTFVPKRFHKYLDNACGLFHEFDYKFVAYLVEDPLLTEEEATGDQGDDVPDADTSPTYIYVHIERKSPDSVDKPAMLHEYEVNVGVENTKLIPAYLLFKFVRAAEKALSSDKDLVLFTGKQTDTHQAPDVSIATICKEIRLVLIEAWKEDEVERKKIVRRLMFKWHPDKNPENVMVSTKVFQYIQQCIQCLEKGRSPPEYKETGHDTKQSTYSGSSSSGGGSWGNEWFRGYWRRYSRHNRYSWNTGGTFFSFHPESDDVPYHFYSEAKRWLEQATFDVNDARNSLAHDGHTDNLICFKAHQVRKHILCNINTLY